MAEQTGHGQASLAAPTQGQSRRWLSASRYYRVIVQLNLFGQWEILRAWGSRTSHLGGFAVQPVSTCDEALALMERESRRRIRRGYQPAP